MAAQIVFVTLFLGIASGTQPLILEATPQVRTIHVLLGGREVALMQNPPWETRIDIGSDLTPRELTAVGYDSDGEEVARVTQVINLPRPTAELDILVDGAQVSLRWEHLMHAAPERGTVTLDGKPLTLDGQFRGALPKLDRETTHILAAELRFPDGVVAQSETVLEAAMSASAATQLTAVGLRTTGKRRSKNWDGCLTRADGTPARTAAVEKPAAQVIVVRDPFPSTGSPSPLEKWLTDQRAHPNWSMRNTSDFDRNTGVRILWAVSQHFSDQESTSELFESTSELNPANALAMLFSEYNGTATAKSARRLSDAVAVAGIRAVTAAQRRAVIYVLSDHSDASKNRAEAVRRYLDTLGVPLFVWSRVGPGTAEWGTVDDISSYAKLAGAVARVRNALDDQRVAWVDAGPLDALKLKADPRCGIETLAHP